MPFLQFTMSQIAVSHLSSAMGESSKMVPELHRELLAAVLALPDSAASSESETLLPLQCGQITPSGQRMAATNSTQTSGSIEVAGRF